MAAPIPAIPCRWPRPTAALQILDETDALETIADYGSRLQAGMSGILDGARHPALALSATRPWADCFSSRHAPDNYRDWLESDYTFYDTHGAGTARVRHPVRTRFTRALVHLRSARQRRQPGTDAGRLRGRPWT